MSKLRLKPSTFPDDRLHLKLKKSLMVSSATYVLGITTLYPETQPWVSSNS